MERELKAYLKLHGTVRANSCEGIAQVLQLRWQKFMDNIQSPPHDLTLVDMAACEVAAVIASLSSSAACLRTLTLERCALASLHLLGETCRWLRRLVLELDTEVSQQQLSLAPLCHVCNLRSLSIACPANAAFTCPEGIRGLKGLRSLELCGRISLTALAIPLRELTQLTRLAIEMHMMPTRPLACLAQSTALRRLTLEVVGGLDCGDLQHLVSLEALSLHGAAVVALPALAQLTRLTRLLLDVEDVDAPMGLFFSVRHLQVDRTLTQQRLWEIAELHNLRELILCCEAVSDLSPLSALVPWLKCIELHSCLCIESLPPELVPRLRYDLAPASDSGSD